MPTLPTELQVGARTNSNGTWLAITHLGTDEPVEGCEEERRVARHHTLRVRHAAEWPARL
eukprot:2520150-Prymnesium_polylepis.1